MVVELCFLVLEYGAAEVCFDTNMVASKFRQTHLIYDEKTINSLTSLNKVFLFFGILNKKISNSTREIWFVVHLFTYGNSCWL